MSVYIGLGSNMGDRRTHLEQALQRMAMLVQIDAVAPVFENPAIFPPGSPASWDQPFLNTVAQVTTDRSPRMLLAGLKQIERDLGRSDGLRWSPRPIDLDILWADEFECDDKSLQVPHPRIKDRAFVLTPLSYLRPLLPLAGQTVLHRRRQIPNPLVSWMAIANLTPDSFSDGGELVGEQIDRFFEEVDRYCVQIIDVGAESTRPGAVPVPADIEQQRLRSLIETYQMRYQGRYLRPWLSVDSRHPSTIAYALEAGADLINDVSGGNPEIFARVADSSAAYVLMHSLSVPADPQLTWPDPCDPIAELSRWLEGKLNQMEKSGLGLERVIFDPGIGFGKTARQSQEILRRIQELMAWPLRLLVGHSRKSFLKCYASDLRQRDWPSVGISVQMARRGVDILRVHGVGQHVLAERAFRESSDLHPP